MISMPRAASLGALSLFASGLLFSGCSSLGPRTVARDRFDYSSSLAESWKRQTLLNIVKLRYCDPPVHVDVGQIVAGYSLETDVSVGAEFPRDQNNNLAVGAGAKYTDRPTITYMPLTGSRFIKSTMMPLPPDSVFFMIQAGYPADAILFSAVTSLNGLRNQDASLSGVSPPAPEFMRVLELLRKVQLSGAVAFRIQQDKEKYQTMLLAFPTERVTPELAADVAELRRLLKLNPDVHEFQLVFGAVQANDHEIAVLTRSLIHIMGMMAAYVEVPAEHVSEGRATPGAPLNGPLRFHSTRSRPSDAFAAVQYRDRWFWIDDCDLKTKRAFAFLMMLFTLADNGEREPMTMITIPAQ